MFILPDLPYPYDALAPAMSAETLKLHHDKHHAKYVDTTNELLAKAGASPTSLEEVVREAAAKGKDGRKLFNNAAQAWNHAFFWDAMSPGPSAPEGELKAAIGKAFGDMAGLRKALVEEGVAHFGSGWVWLAAGPGGLEVLSTHDGDNLLTRPEQTPLQVCDLWEHAYYVDYRNDRKGFVEAWFDGLANWAFAAEQLAGRTWRYPAPQAAERRSA